MRGSFILVIVEGEAAALKFFPVEVFGSVAVFDHGDAIGDGADQLAEVATHAFFFLDRVRVIGMALAEVDGLVGGVFAGDITEAAVDAFCRIDMCYDMIVEVQVLPMGEGRYGPADKVFDTDELFFIHPVA